MKNTHTGIKVILLSVAFAFSISNLAVAADRMTYDEYLGKLKFFQDRETALMEEIAKEENAITDLRTEIKMIANQIAAVWEDIYVTLGIKSEDLDKVRGEIGMVEKRLDGLAKLPPDQLLERSDEFAEIAAEISTLMSDPSAKLTEVQEHLNALTSRLDMLEASLPKLKPDEKYSVIRGDCLWRISGKDHIYNDPWKWLRIYSANRGQINDPDLIFPGQMFVIPRRIGDNEHLVMRGEYLSKIAGYIEVYGDPFKWTKIYQANKSNGFIEDPNLIYPEQILLVPRD